MDEHSASPTSTAKKACDQCRLRKTKCNLAQPCVNCIARNFECTYDTPHRRRGPAGKRLAQIKQQQQQQQQQQQHGASRNRESIGSSIGLPAASSQLPLNTVSQQDGPLSFGSSTPENRQADVIVNQSWNSPDRLSGTDQDVSGMGQDDGYLVEPSLGQPPTGSDTLSPGPGPFDDIAFSLLARQPSASITPTQGLLRPQAFVPAIGWPAAVTDENLIRWIDIYFDRLYPTLPVLKRSSVFARLLKQEHRTNPDFGAMLLALSAFSLIQPLRLSERASSHSRENVVNLLLMEAVQMRSSVSFGENPSLDMILTSVFLFACLFQKGQHNAAWLRLREAVELGCIYGLCDPDNYVNCEPYQKQDMLRIYYLLSVTERAYALERKHPIAFYGRPGLKTKSFLDSSSSASDNDFTGIVIHDDADSAGMLGLLLLTSLFDSIDEDFLRCWNGHCKADVGGCRFLSVSVAKSIHDQINNMKIPSPASSTRAAGSESLPDQSTGSQIPTWLTSATLKDSQKADILINQQWLLQKHWQLCLTHKFLAPEADHPALCVYSAVTIAEATLRLCQALPMAAMEVHGLGLIEKLYCIIESAAAARRYGEGAYEYAGATGELSVPLYTPLPNSTTLPVLGGSSSGSDPFNDLLGGFHNLFRTLRAGQHPYLARFTALVGQDLGPDAAL